MKVEKIRILAEDFGLEDAVNKLILMRKYELGEMAFTASGKKRDIEIYGPMQIKQKAYIMKRLAILTDGMFEGWHFSYGRLGNGETFVTFWNPEWR